MEYLEGEELRTLIKREKRLPPERIVRMLSQVAIGLDSAHRQGSSTATSSRTTSFSAARARATSSRCSTSAPSKTRASMAKKLTVVGTTIGSPFYMAPEQAQGLDTLDARADVWALAAITYECITGNGSLSRASTARAFSSRSSPRTPSRRRRPAKTRARRFRRQSTISWKSRWPRIPTSAPARWGSSPTRSDMPTGSPARTSIGRTRRKLRWPKRFRRRCPE